MSCVSSSQVGVNPSVQSNIESQPRWIYDEAEASGLGSEVDPNIQMEVDERVDKEDVPSGPDASHPSRKPLISISCPMMA